MATQKKTTTSSLKKSTSKSKPIKKATPKKSLNKSKTGKKTTSKKHTQKKITKQSNRKLSYSTIIIIILVVSAYFYMNWGEKVDKDILNQIEEQQSDIDIQNESITGKELSYYFPSANLLNGGIINHLAYSLDYNEDAEQADWVFYELTKEEVQNNSVERKDKFVKDPSTSISSALPTDYYKSGYDRGHLCPAADNRWSQDAMTQSFYMSNMSPQHPDLNRKIWKELEEKVREWAVDNDEVFVVTGPILADGFKKKIGKSNVAVPKYFYKVVADLTGDEIKGIGFIFVNGENNGELKYYACPIDIVEKRTKIDFFPNLNDNIEQQVESDYIIEDWF